MGNGGHWLTQGKNYFISLVAFCHKMAGFVDRRYHLHWLQQASNTLPQCPCSQGGCYALGRHPTRWMNTWFSGRSQRWWSLGPICLETGAQGISQGQPWNFSSLTLLSMTWKGGQRHQWICMRAGQLSRGTWTGGRKAQCLHALGAGSKGSPALSRRSPSSDPGEVASSGMKALSPGGWWAGQGRGLEIRESFFSVRTAG